MNEDKASRYHRLRRRADLAGTLTAGAALLALIVTDGSIRLRESTSMVGTAVAPIGYEETGTIAFFTLALGLVLQLIELPFAYYQGYLLEHRYGLSNQNLSHWLKDQVKAALLALAFSVVGASLVYWSLRAFPDAWWLVSAGMFAFATIVLAQVAPVLLLPLFYQFKPLDRPALADRLTRLASRANTRIRGVFEWTLSAHTKKANAALAGIGNTRRILLSDTLLADYSDEEIEVVLAHELSHHVHHDLWHAMAVQGALLLFAFFGANLALRQLAEPLTLRGLDDPAGLPLLLLVGAVCSLVFMPIANAFSRLHERRADRYALEMTRQPEAFVSAMKRLSQQNLAEEHPSRIVKWVFYSHPPINERIEAARRWGARNAPYVAAFLVALMSAAR